MRSGLRVLLTNNTLAGRAGTELYVRDVALALVRRGHNPVAYSTVLGEVAEELRRATVPVIDDLGALEAPPDVIHGQHHLDAMAAMLRFPDVPAIYVCHGWLPWEEQPPVFPSIRRYVAVSHVGRERLLTTSGVRPEAVEILYNFVDLDRFGPRNALPDRPKSALVFNSYVAEDSAFARAVRSACARFGIERVELAGGCAGKPVSRPEDLLPDHDVVFAMGRSALEALAVGCAVVVAGSEGLGGMVTTERLERMRALNFGLRAMQSAPVTRASLLAELARYDAREAAGVSGRVRAEAGLEAAVDRLVALYREVVAPAAQSVPPDGIAASCVAASTYLAGIGKAIKARHEADRRAGAAEAALRQAEQRAVNAREREAALEGGLSAAQRQVDALRRELAEIHGSKSWRALALYRRLRARLFS